MTAPKPIDVSAMLQSIAGPAKMSGCNGRPYQLLATSGGNELFINLSFGDNLITLEKEAKITAAGLIVRFRRSEGCKTAPVPDREGSLLKKYFIPICTAPVNSFNLRDKVHETQVFEKAQEWVAARMKAKKWKLSMSKVNFILYGESLFSDLPDSPPSLDAMTMPEW